MVVICRQDTEEISNTVTVHLAETYKAAENLFYALYRICDGSTSF